MQEQQQQQQQQQARAPRRMRQRSAREVGERSEEILELFNRIDFQVFFPTFENIQAIVEAPVLSLCFRMQGFVGVSFGLEHRIHFLYTQQLIHPELPTYQDPLLRRLLLALIQCAEDLFQFVESIRLHNLTDTNIANELYPVSRGALEQRVLEFDRYWQNFAAQLLRYQTSVRFYIENGVGGLNIFGIQPNMHDTILRVSRGMLPSFFAGPVPNMSRQEAEGLLDTQRRSLMERYQQRVNWDRALRREFEERLQETSSELWNLFQEVVLPQLNYPEVETYRPRDEQAIQDMQQAIREEVVDGHTIPGQEYWSNHMEHCINDIHTLHLRNRFPITVVLQLLENQREQNDRHAQILYLSQRSLFRSFRVRELGVQLEQMPDNNIGQGNILDVESLRATLEQNTQHQEELQREHGYLLDPEEGDIVWVVPEINQEPDRRVQSMLDFQRFHLDNREYLTRQNEAVSVGTQNTFQLSPVLPRGIQPLAPEYLQAELRTFVQNQFHQENRHIPGPYLYENFNPVQHQRMYIRNYLSYIGGWRAEIQRGLTNLTDPLIEEIQLIEEQIANQNIYWNPGQGQYLRRLGRRNRVEFDQPERET